MSVKYETFLQDQINQLEIEVAKLKVIVKVLIETAQESNYRIEELDDRIPPKKME